MGFALVRDRMRLESAVAFVAAIVLSLVSALAIADGLALAWIAALLCLSGLVLGLRDWERSTYWLLAYLPISGVPTILAYPHTAVPNLLKDLLFVVPAYLGFVTTHVARRRPIVFKGAPTVLLGLFGLLVALQMFNPDLPNALVGAVGFKVWLFYTPLLYVGYHLIRSRADLERVLKVMALTAVVPIAIGIAEAVLIASRHGQDVYRYYGPAAGAATQHFGGTTYAGGGSSHRVPSTFAFVTQYYIFAAAMVAITYAWWRCAAPRHRRRTRWILWLSALGAAFLCGARGAFLFIPLLVGLTLVLEHGIARLPVARIVTLASALVVAVGLLGAHTSVVVAHTIGVGREEFGTVFVKGAGFVLRDTPLGKGTGIDTGAARYVAGGANTVGGQESWYVKAGVELGIAGFVLLALLVSVVILRGLQANRQVLDPSLRAVSASLLAFLIWNAIYGIKSSSVDLDPANVYFWFFAGVLYKIPTLAPGRARSAAAEPSAVPS